MNFSTSGPTGAALRLHGVCKAYGRRAVLRGVTLDVPRGCLLGIVGANGAGKSTLLRILVGQAAADSGTVLCRGRIGYCPQNTVLHPALTVREHVRFFRAAYRLDDCRRAWELLEQLRFDESPRSRLHTLSGGTLQKLNLAVGLMHDPEVLLLDEPYQGFDWETYLRFWEIAGDLCERGRTVVVVSHLAHDRERLDVLHRLRDGVLTPDHVGAVEGVA
ncbi:ATP-binding cassette domain-containing protein [Streptomyces alkaliphilus]|uniref:ATP-binding cassette domain-containing protein n=1 Tax=Streptomyces alkaliphilus TaxID=1472722 RepID=A0A7W3TBN5_9ACTN|nr:ATP-binding cassette domain-containing protein [Streptomyces alkaliphilus]MBB0243495.1 ATP-binding cassette domain-containing protein [Streptomyces alkaliphilus]